MSIYEQILKLYPDDNGTGVWNNTNACFIFWCMERHERLLHFLNLTIAYLLRHGTRQIGDGLVTIRVTSKLLVP